ncbi:hypothetical protein, partial [Escherichia coli]|uniref:hypothetical protein n=1 Tax=Escherichia coli TaxID=562 RepID=UPI0005E3DB61
MKLKMQAMDGPVIIESSDVTQFYPDHESGGGTNAGGYLSGGGRINPGGGDSFFLVRKEESTAELPSHSD